MNGREVSCVRLLQNSVNHRATEDPPEKNSPYSFHVCTSVLLNFTFIMLGKKRTRIRTVYEMKNEIIPTKLSVYTVDDARL